MTPRAVPAAAVAAAAGAAWWVGWREPRSLVVRELELALPHWPARLDGLRAGVMTDLHTGVPHMGLAAVRRAVDALNAAGPDVQLVLGDVLDSSQPWRRTPPLDDVAAAIARLQAPLGVHAVLGNHDWRAAGVRIGRALASAGVHVMDDDAIELDLRRPAAADPSGAADGAGAERGGPFWLAGLGDLRYRDPSIARTLARVPQDAPVILLSHDPDVFPDVPARVALTLSGHLHGGQVAIPHLRVPMMPTAYGERYARGLVEEGGRLLYVSSGLGTSGLPIRFLAPPEVLVLTLRSRPPGRGSAA